MEIESMEHIKKISNTFNDNNNNDDDDDDGGSGRVRKHVFCGDFGPGTIASDDEVENYSGSDSETEDVVTYRRRGEKKDDFYKDFNFGESTSALLKDPWDHIIKMMKTKDHVNIDKTIDKVRAEEGHRWKTENGNDDDDDEIIDEDMNLKDELVVKEAEVKRKAKRADNPKKIQLTAAEMKQEKESREFFEDAPLCSTDVTFLEMNFSRALLKAIDRLGYDTPTPIQAACIPVALQGRDICGCAATGTGKTAAYMLPIIERLLFKPSSDVVTRVLILIPTRELGVQVYQVAKDLSLYSHIQISLSVGGMDLTSQEQELKKAPDIVIATPGRLIDHLLNTPSFNLESIEILVLDEADRMLDDSFAEQMSEIIKQCSGERQTLLFSATMTAQVQELAMVSLKNPVKVFVNENTDVARNLRQEFIRIRKNDEKVRPAILAYLVSRTFSEHCMVFVSTKALAHQLNILLGLLGCRSGELHGDLKQADRLMSLKKFKEEEIDVLIATDVAARGLDIKGVKTVINYNMPNTYKRYVHRVGRTARIGHAGRSVSLAGDQEFNMLREIKRYSKTAMFERKLVQEVLEKYKAKIQKLTPSLKRVLEEEKQERLLRKMEQEVASLEKKVKSGGGKSGEQLNGEQERSWFLSKADVVKAETKRMAVKGKQVIKQLKTQKNKENKRTKQNKHHQNTDPAEREINKAVRRQQLKAKKEGKAGRIKAVIDDDDVMEGSGGRKKREKRKRGSNFDHELTKTDSRSVKKFRSGPSYRERKEDFELNNPGKKFKPKGGRKGKK